MKIITETLGARRAFILQISIGRTAFPSPPSSLVIVTLTTQNLQFNDDVLCEKNYTYKTKRMKEIHKNIHSAVGKKRIGDIFLPTCFCYFPSYI